MQTKSLFCGVAGCFFAACLPEGESRGEKDTDFGVYNRSLLRLQSLVYEELIDSAALTILTRDSLKVGQKPAFIFKDRQEVFISHGFYDPQYDKICEIKIYSRDGSNSYQGKNLGLDIISRANPTDCNVFPHKVTASLSLSNILDSVPSNQTFSWIWTGDASGGGSENSIRYNTDTLVIDSAAHIHFTTHDSAFDNGSYVFRFKARSLDFGWRIPDSTAGKSLRLSYDPVAAPNRITLARGNWYTQTTDFADSLDYMYEPDLWHVVQIIDSAGILAIYFDGVKLDFFRTRPASQYLSGLGSGGLGIGTHNSGMKVSSILGLR